jgi:ABC-type proline/glycine betaine transport system permease subunit
MKIPLSDWVNSAVKWLEKVLDPVFQAVALLIGSVVNTFEWLFTVAPSFIFIAVAAIFAFWLGRWPFAAFTALGLLLIDNLGYWEGSMETLALVVTSAFISVMIGVPVGILCARHDSIRGIITPVLDFMQTMPAFVYLIPAVTFFGLGVVPGVIASVIFAIPPTIRLTKLGIRQVPAELVEAADAFGSTSRQKLFKLQLPLAVPTIMAGINQTIMLSLSMVVIASMIGAQGIGAEVYKAVTQVKIGEGFAAGLAIVILAIILDRFSQHLVNRKNRTK